MFKMDLGSGAFGGHVVVALRGELDLLYAPTVAGVVGLALVTVVVFTLSLTLPSRPTCTGTVVSIAARMTPLPTGSQAACATKQSEPSKTRPAGADYSARTGTAGSLSGRS